VDPRPVLFVADLHLTPERPDGMAAFARFLGGPARDAQAVVILGDLFEYWIGADDALARPVLEQVATLAAGGVDVAFMPGNRDFLVDAATAWRTGITLLADPTIATFFGRDVLLAHGDAYCTDDAAYQRFRSRIRAPFVQGLLRRLPLSLRRAIARRARSASEQSKRTKAPVIMDVNADAIADAFRAAGCDLMIHGHTHRPARHVHDVDGRTCVRWVLADWFDQGRYLAMDADGLREVRLT